MSDSIEHGQTPSDQPLQKTEPSVFWWKSHLKPPPSTLSKLWLQATTRTTGIHMTFSDNTTRTPSWPPVGAQTTGTHTVSGGSMDRRPQHIPPSAAAWFPALVLLSVSSSLLSTTSLAHIWLLQTAVCHTVYFFPNSLHANDYCNESYSSFLFSKAPQILD